MNRRAVSDRAANVVTLSALALIVMTFAPWITTGSRTRRSYDLFGLIDRLEFAPNGLVAWMLRLWPFVPLACVATAVLVWWPRRRLAAAAGIVVSLYAGGIAGAIWWAPIETAVGVRTTAISAGLLLAASIVLLATATAATGNATQTVATAARNATETAGTTATGNSTETATATVAGTATATVGTETTATGAVTPARSDAP